MKLKELEYRRFGQGWLLAPKKSIHLPARIATFGWNSVDLGTHSLRLEKHAKHSAGHHKDISVHVIGIVMDVQDFGLDEPEICAQLAETLKRSGWSALYERLMPLAGAFILFIRHQGHISVILDAVGSVPAYYDVDRGNFVASHPQLVAKAIGSAESDVAKAWRDHPALGRGGAYMPGLLTEFTGVELITPNHRFSLKDKRMVRFYPTRDLPQLSPDEIAERLAPMLSGQLIKLASSYRLAISLSGGVDTRLTLAASRAVSSSATYFTYFTKQGILATDREVASELATSLALRHIEFPSSTPLTDEERRLKSKYETMLRKGNNNFAIAKHIKGFLHIRSNTLEVGRGFYLKNPANHSNHFTSEKLSRLFRRDTKDEFQPYFRSFMDKTAFKSQNFFNLHYTDIFYWEHRLPVSYGALYRDGRAYFETYMIYNCRLVLEMMLSTSLENRTSAAVVFALIEKMWPETLEAPIFSGSKFLDTSRYRTAQATMRSANEQV